MRCVFASAFGIFSLATFPAGFFVTSENSKAEEWFKDWNDLSKFDVLFGNA